MISTSERPRHRARRHRNWMLIGLLGLAGAAQAQDYPSKPVRLVVGFSAGGPTDIVARAFAEYAGRALGKSFIVENKPGANTVLAAEAVASAPADGYTLLLGATNHTMIPALRSTARVSSSMPCVPSHRSARWRRARPCWWSARP